MEAIAPLSFISVSVFCEFAKLPGVLLSPQEEGALFFLRGFLRAQMYTSGSTFMKKISMPW